MDLKLMVAARSGNYHPISKEKYNLLESVTAGKNNVLHVAGKSGNKAFVEELIASSHVNHDDHSSTFQELLLQPNNRGDTPLHCAAAAGSLEVVKLVIFGMEDADIEKKNNHGDTALHLALNGDSSGHLEVVKVLVRRHERLGFEKNHSKEFPVYVAAERGSLEALAYLLKFPQFPATGPNDKTALHAAVARTADGYFKLLLEEKPELLLQEDADGSTPLHYVASSGDDRMTRELLTHGDDIFFKCHHNYKNIEDGTNLHNRTHVAYISDKRGLSPIHVASVMGHVHVIEEILKSRPDAYELVDKRGRTFLHLAVKHKWEDVVTFVIECSDELLKAKEILNQQDDNGNTPLHLAVRYHHYGILKILLNEKETITTVRNFDGFTPLDLAASDFKSSNMKHRMFEIIKHLIYSNAEFSARRLDHMDNQKSQEQMQADEEKEAARCRAIADNLTIVSVLIATVTFAAAFTLPGGYDEESGKAVLADKVAFRTFLITDTLAMVTSMVVTYLLVQTRSQDHDIRSQSINTSKGLMKISIGTLAMAFGTGTYVVISINSEWLANAVVAMSSVVPLALYTIKTWPSIYHKLQKKTTSFCWKILKTDDSRDSRIHRWWPTFEARREKISQRVKIDRWRPSSMTHFHSPVAITKADSLFPGELGTQDYKMMKLRSKKSVDRRTSLLMN